ncbi:MFS transporter [Nonomuraea roseoviolacea subsp. roseoviolacea]|uniref:MHS family alpha-ketoglutarate permease-like MFS transporter n=1 Tax=Nonomuraea roseoviolacea subsp. carminata TaxID=160689 RepID=A0ABT1JW47_9ACTN|nr:MFS transporter [Nonomuraea roseoviolacea]MCP2345998.1 MHS family alpha-ketoglutarate permease-like MFS transporter [Nonomuraea roseoviolacea subsp. carminata]
MATSPVAPSTVGIPRSRVRQLMAASVGNVVEWFDWYTYSFLAIYFSKQIFPETDNSLVPLLSGFAVFAVGFFMRPLGGLLVGAFADRFGRKAAMTFTIILMGGGSLLLAVTPTYAAAGVLAPIVLTLARLIQGLSVGGEFAAATTFLVESAPPGRRGLFSSFQYVSTTIGQLLASGLAALLAKSLSEADMSSYGWRIPFVVGAVISLVGLWIRKGAEETSAVAEEIREGKAERPALFEFLVRYPTKAALIVGITVAGTVSYYTWTTFLPTYAQLTVKFDKADALTVGTISLLFFMVLQPLLGMLSDRIGRKPMLIVFGLAFLILPVPLLGMLSNSFASLLFVQCLGMVFLGCYTSIAAAINSELFPTRVRAAGVGFPYSLTVAIFGGTAPLIGTALQEAGNMHLFPWYVSALALISTCVYAFALKETKDQPLS